MLYPVELRAQEKATRNDAQTWFECQAFPAGAVQYSTDGRDNDAPSGFLWGGRAVLKDLGS